MNVTVPVSGPSRRPVRCAWGAVALVAVLLLPAQLTAQSAWPSERSRGEPILSGTNILLASLVVAPLLFVEPLEGMDESLSPETTESLSIVRGVGRAFGDPFVGLGLTAGTALVGALTQHEDIKQIGIVSLKALLAADIATGILKVTVGRARPDYSSHPDDFRPFSFNRDQYSFPSGHTAHAFSIATVLTRRFGQTHAWVPYAVYSVATATAVSRVLDRQHWVTDVVAGAAIGTLAGRLVGVGPSEASDSGPGRRAVVMPILSDGVGIGVRLRVN